MAATPSTMPPLGMAAPDFSLPDASGRNHSLEDFSGSPGLLVAFICYHCPFVVHIRKEFGAFAREYQEKGLAVVAIVSNSDRVEECSFPTSRADFRVMTHNVHKSTLSKFRP